MLIRVFLCLALLPAAARAAVKNQDTFVYLVVNEVDSLDPAWHFDTVSRIPTENLYETLIAYKGDSVREFEPLLAEKVPSRENGLISEDGKTYRFPIRKGVRFHHGAALTPEDVRYSFMRLMLLDRSGGPSSSLLEPLLGLFSTRDENGRLRADAFLLASRAVQVEGDEVVLRLPAPYPALLPVLADVAKVLSKSWAVEHGDWDGTEAAWAEFNDPPKQNSPFHMNADGTGPFLLERWDQASRQVVLARNDAYWRKPPALRRVVIKTVVDLQTRKLMLQAGDADLIDVTNAHASQLRGLEGVRVLDRLPSLSTDPVLIFVQQISTQANPFIGSGRLDGDGIPPDFFTDLDVRRGLSYAFDYEAFRRDVQKDTSVRARGAIPPALLGHDPNGLAYTLDLAKAAAHLKKAWGGRLWERGFRFSITHVPGADDNAVACQILKRNVESLNPKFHVDVAAVYRAVSLDVFKKLRSPMAVRGWIGDPDPHSFIFEFYHSRGGWAQLQSFGDPALDRMIEGAQRESAPAVRERMYRDIQRRAHDAAPSILISHSTKVYGARAWTRGLRFNPALWYSRFYGVSKSD